MWKSMGDWKPQTNFVLPLVQTHRSSRHIWLACVFPLCLFARLRHARLVLAGALFSWFRVSPKTLLLLHVVCSLHAQIHERKRVCVCLSGGFRGTAGFAVFQLRVQECDTQEASTFSCAAPVAQSLLRIHNKIVWCQDTPRTCVQVIRPLVRNMRVAQVLNPRHLLPCPLASRVFLRKTRNS